MFSTRGLIENNGASNSLADEDKFLLITFDHNRMCTGTIFPKKVLFVGLGCLIACAVHYSSGLLCLVVCAHLVWGVWTQAWVEISPGCCIHQVALNSHIL